MNRREERQGGRKRKGVRGREALAGAALGNLPSHLLPALVVAPKFSSYMGEGDPNWMSALPPPILFLNITLLRS